MSPDLNVLIISYKFFSGEAESRLSYEHWLNLKVRNEKSPGAELVWLVKSLPPKIGLTNLQKWFVIDKMKV